MKIYRIFVNGEKMSKSFSRISSAMDQCETLYAGGKRLEWDKVGDIYKAQWIGVKYHIKMEIVE